MAKSKPPSPDELLHDSFDSLARTALKVKADRDALLSACKRITQWLDKLAQDSAERAKDTRFITLSEANAADAKNFAITSESIKKVIQKAEE